MLHPGVGRLRAKGRALTAPIPPLGCGQPHRRTGARRSVITARLKPSRGVPCDLAVNARDRITMGIRRAINRRGYVLSKRVDAVDQPFGETVGAIYSRVEPYTMTPAVRLAALVEAVDYLIGNEIEGAIMECGVWRGGSMMAAALRLDQLGATRDLYLFDTFSGMTKPSAEDVTTTGQSMLDTWDEAADGGAAVSLEDVRAAMATTGYDKSRIHYIKGPVEETVPEHAPARIALLRLDTDWYESTRHELEHLYQRLVPGGVLIIDDFGYFKGARKAVEDFFAGQHALLIPTDPMARFHLKPLGS